MRRAESPNNEPFSDKTFIAFKESIPLLTNFLSKLKDGRSNCSKLNFYITINKSNKELEYYGHCIDLKTWTALSSANAVLYLQRLLLFCDAKFSNILILVSFHSCPEIIWKGTSYSFSVLNSHIRFRLLRWIPKVLISQSFCQTVNSWTFETISNSTCKLWKNGTPDTLYFAWKIRSSHPEVFLTKGVLKICSKFTGEHACRSVISIKVQSNFIEITLRHMCSPVNLLHIHLFLRTPLDGCFWSFTEYFGKIYPGYRFQCQDE